jgi:CSLREA domain-containing protein
MVNRTVLLLTVAGGMLLASFAGVLSMKIAQAAANFTVNSQADAADAALGDGTCATLNGECTMRAAIEEANRHRGPDTIAFAIPGSGVHTITLGSVLPTISDKTGPTFIDGYTQPGSSPNTDPLISNARIMVQISAPTDRGSNGMVVTSPGNTIRGLAFFKLGDSIALKGSSASGNTVVGNFVGTDAAGNYVSTKGLPGDGIALRSGAHHNSIGGTASTGDTCIGGTAAERNVVSGNSFRGVALFGEGTKYNCIINNIVGLGPAGDKALPNHTHGIDVNRGSSLNQVGGTGQGMINVVSGNMENGVEVSHLSTTVGNRVVGNFIGTDVTGATGPPYALNGKSGVHLEDHVVNSEVVDNVIGNNADSGVWIEQGSTGTVVRGNQIGLSLNGNSIPNKDHGVFIVDNSSGSLIGPNNVITNNLVSGIVVRHADTDRNTITGNSIYGNRSLGIDLDPVGAVNPNDAGDVDTGPNQQLNFPVITMATPQLVAGSTCGGCRVEVFRADRGNGAHGQGKTFVGLATADSGGSFVATVSGVAEGDYVSTTATDASGNTSEFSLNQAVVR